MIGGTPTGFVLYGGTAIALRLAHRQSIDFDFFSRSSFRPDALRRKIPYLKESRTIQSEENTLTSVINLGREVKLSFSGGLEICSVNDPDEAQGPGILVASLLDLAATKAAEVQSRPSARDYIDLDAVLGSGLSLATVLGAANADFGPGFNPVLTLKALTFFGDGDLNEVPRAVRENLKNAVAAVDLRNIPVFQPRARLSPNEPRTENTHDV